MTNKPIGELVLDVIMLRKRALEQKATRAMRMAEWEEENATLLAHLGFDAAGIDDETLLNLTRYADSSVPVKIAITLG